MGVTLAGPLGIAPDTLAALGFVAVFAAAANTPIACVIMGMEIFGGSGIVLFGIAIFVAYTISGDRGIYHSQRVLSSKHLHETSPSNGSSLAEIRQQRRPPANGLNSNRRVYVSWQNPKRATSTQFAWPARSSVYRDTGKDFAAQRQHR